MKVLALTDIHGSYSIAEKIIYKEQPDVVILGGDLTNAGTVKEAEQAVKQFQLITPTVLCVAGNMDLPQHDELFIKLGISIHGQGKVISNIGFFGCSASPYSPLHTPYEISEDEITHHIISGFKQVQQCRIKILVTHAPPFGTKVDIVHAGFHVGSRSVRDFIEKKKPDVCICGHIHEARGQDELEKTKIINCGSGEKGFYGVCDIGNEIMIYNRRLTD